MRCPGAARRESEPSDLLPVGERLSLAADQLHWQGPSAGTDVPTRRQLSSHSHSSLAPAVSPAMKPGVRTKPMMSGRSPFIPLPRIHHRHPASR